MQWTDVCSVSDLQENSGVCALVNGVQVAIFYLPTDEQGVYAINNYDPIGKANVLSRGIIGDIKGHKVVASPLYKEHFDLQTGACLEDDTVTVPVYACQIENGRVQVDTHLVALIENSTNAQQQGVSA
ncbi:MAG: nitrite reductase small subunit NirD [Methylococcales bacterium]|nr:nitrite reductase small subunit NirD [Methylococcales bacterium]